MDKANGNQGRNFIQVLGSIINQKEKDLLNQVFLNIKATSKMDINMAGDFSYLAMEIVMKAITQMENLKAMELIIGVMVQSIRESSKMDYDLDMEFGNSAHRNMKELT